MKKVVKVLGRLIYCNILLIPVILFSGCSEDLYGKIPLNEKPTLASPVITASVYKNYYRTDEHPTITLTSVAGATIFYYYDGNAASAIPYTSDLSIGSSGSTISITAYARHPDYNDSPSITRSFSFVASGSIVTIAGRSTGGNESYAIQAELFSPGQIIAVQGPPLFYITEATQNRVRTIDSNSRIQAYAGSGAAGSSGDGGAAINATLRAPSGVCSDGANTYIVDPINRTILHVNNGGLIRKICTPETPTMNPLTGTNTAFRPTGICLDPGNPNPPTPRDPCLYITDAGNNCVWEVPVPGGIVISRAMMGGSSGITPNPVSVCFDPDTLDLYGVSQYEVSVSGSADAVWKIPHNLTGAVYINSTVPDPDLSNPTGICINGNYLYIADTGNHCIRSVLKNLTTPVDTDITVIAGIPNPTKTPGFSVNGTLATSALLNSPQGVFVHDNQVYIADTGNNCIRQILSY